jgi:hypothetical protein
MMNKKIFDLPLRSRQLAKNLGKGDDLRPVSDDERLVLEKR